MINCDRWNCECSPSCCGCCFEPTCWETELSLSSNPLRSCRRCDKRDVCKAYPLIVDFVNGRRDRHLDLIEDAPLTADKKK